MTEIEKQGLWGEKYIANMFKSNGYNVVMNPDKFGVWDLFIHQGEDYAKTVQVKTMVRFVTKNYFGITGGKTKQAAHSVKFADMLILVIRTPDVIADPDWEGKVLLVKDHRDYKLNRDGQIVIPSNLNNFTVLGTLTREQLNEVNSFKTGKSYKNKSNDRLLWA